MTLCFAIRRMASEGASDYTIAAATKFSVEFVRRGRGLERRPPQPMSRARKRLQENRLAKPKPRPERLEREP